MPRKKVKYWQRAFIFKRDNFTCKICNIKGYNIPSEYDGKRTIAHVNMCLVLDHIIPYSKGGLCEIDNFQTLCNKCNSIKGIK